jgi:hypothetical protein
MVAVLAVALAGTANAAGWRSLRVDGSSEASFVESVAAFQHKLSPGRRHVFERALQDIWVQGTKGAGHTARMRYQAASARPSPRVAPQKSPWPERPAPMGYQGQQVRGLSNAVLQTGQAACGCLFPY